MATKDNYDFIIRSRHNRYFSESFRKRRVREIERKLVTVGEVSREYNVSRTSIYRWIYKYSRHLNRQSKQIVELKSDTRKILELKKKIKELEQIVGQKQILIEFQEKMIEIAEKEYNVDIKKKFGSKPSSTSGQIDNTDTR